MDRKNSRSWEYHHGCVQYIPPTETHQTHHFHLDLTNILQITNKTSPVKYNIFPIIRMIENLLFMPSLNKNQFLVSQIQIHIVREKKKRKTHLIETSTFWRALICWAVAQRAHNEPSTFCRFSRVTLVNSTSIFPASSKPFTKRKRTGNRYN